MSKLEELRLWLNQFPADSEIATVESSNWGDDAMIIVKTPDGNYHSKEILSVVHLHAS